MTAIDAIQPLTAGAVAPSPASGAIGSFLTADVSAAGGAVQPAPLPAAEAVGAFARMLGTGVADMQASIDRANAMVRAYALDESLPAHQVMIALEEARITVELGLQVRNRLVEAYRDIMNMQM